MAYEHVAGRNVGRIVLYALSTCPWCQKTRQLLDMLGVDYYYIYVDRSPDDERLEAIRTLQKWNPATSFPTLVIDDRNSIVGFKEPEIREALKG